MSMTVSTPGSTAIPAEGGHMPPDGVRRAVLAGYPRGDGRKGIRNVVAVAYLVECAHHVAREIVAQFRAPLRFGRDAAPGADEPSVHLIGFPGCYPNGYAEKMIERLATHPNVG
ncbi:UxaA family hydrolase, partial [Burkholderia thailandensis]